MHICMNQKTSYMPYKTFENKMKEVDRNGSESNAV